MSSTVEAAPPLSADRVTAMRVRTVQTALALGSLAVIAVLLVRPGPDRTDLSYAAVAAGRDAAWLGHLVECLGYGLAGPGLGIAACLLVRARGAIWATVGAVLLTIGGVFFAAAGWAIGVVSWYATATEALPVPQGTAFLRYVEGNLGHAGAADVIGFLGLTLGLLAVCVAFWRSGAVPKGLTIAIAALTLAQFGPWPDRLFDVEQALLAGTFVGVAWYAGLSTRRAASTSA